MRRYQDSIQKAGVELEEEHNMKVSKGVKKIRIGGLFTFSFF